MWKKKVRKDYVIRAQKEVIQAQDALIEWLLQLVEGARNQTETIDCRNLSEVLDGHD